MDIKAYIESGIVERYLLGQLSSQEEAEIGCLRKIYPELEEALGEMQRLERHLAEQVAQTPPAYLKAKILSQIPPREMTQEDKAANRLPTNNKTARSSNRAWRVAAAVLFLLGLASVYQWQLERSQWQQSRQMLSQQSEILEEALRSEQNFANEQSRYLQFLARPNLQPVALNSVTTNEALAAKLYWDAERQEALFHRGNLGASPEGKQFQLWYLRDGEPVSMGLVALDPSQDFHFFPAAEAVDAFALSLEPEGGSKQPTLSALVVLGEV